jgi:hypothetical protein
LKYHFVVVFMDFGCLGPGAGEQGKGKLAGRGGKGMEVLEAMEVLARVGVWGLGPELFGHFTFYSKL